MANLVEGSAEKAILDLNEVEFYSEEKLIGMGNLLITDKSIVWVKEKSANENTVQYKLSYYDVILHAISRETDSFPKECIYCQVDENVGSREIRIVPKVPSLLDTVYQAICDGSRLNPDFDEGGNVKENCEALDGLACMLGLMSGSQQVNSTVGMSSDNNTESVDRRNMLEKFDSMLRVSTDDVDITSRIIEKDELL